MRMKASSPRGQAYRLVLLQMLAAGALTLGWLLFIGWKAAISALSGGLAAVLPSLYFAYRFFAATQARQVNRIIKAFYWGELTKLLLTGALVIIFLRLWPEIELLPFFSSFVGACMGFWLAPWLIKL